ncbi:MAG: DNA glycosylase AlkZ-like family protein, partial [Candidatus Limnocylindrales bacterium]
GAYAEHIMARIAADGPLGSADFEQEPAIDWYWRPTNRARAILEALWEAGALGLACRDGNRRTYDLAERLYPPDLLAHAVPEQDQLRHKLLSRYRAHGLLGAGGRFELWLGIDEVDGDGRHERAPVRRRLLDELLARDLLRPVSVEGVRGLRYVLPEDLPLLDQAAAEVAAGRERHGVAFLAPLDPLLWDRDFLATLYDFDYVWEVYVPAARRRWGYYVLPILCGDRLVGRIEPRIDRQAGTVTIVGLWFEPAFDPRRADGFVPALRAALADHLAFAESGRLVWGPGLGGWARRIGHPRPSAPDAPAVSSRP